MRDTIELAREAGADTLLYWDIEKLKRFESLVRADERDGCILELERNADKTLEDIVAAIRERGSK
jgi:diphthamide biosynthesis methyltransferase